MGQATGPLCDEAGASPAAGKARLSPAGSVGHSCAIQDAEQHQAACTLQLSELPQGQQTGAGGGSGDTPVGAAASCGTVSDCERLNNSLKVPHDTALHANAVMLVGPDQQQGCQHEVLDTTPHGIPELQQDHQQLPLQQQQQGELPLQEQQPGRPCRQHSIRCDQQRAPNSPPKEASAPAAEAATAAGGVAPARLAAGPVAAAGQVEAAGAATVLPAAAGTVAGASVPPPPTHAHPKEPTVTHSQSHADVLMCPPGHAQGSWPAWPVGTTCHEPRNARKAAIRAG